MEEKWCSIDWTLDLKPGMLQKSREKVLEEVSRHPRSILKEQSDLGTFVVLSPDGDFFKCRRTVLVKMRQKC